MIRFAPVPGGRLWLFTNGVGSDPSPASCRSLIAFGAPEPTSRQAVEPEIDPDGKVAAAPGGFTRGARKRRRLGAHPRPRAGQDADPLFPTTDPLLRRLELEAEDREALAAFLATL